MVAQAVAWKTTVLADLKKAEDLINMLEEDGTSSAMVEAAFDRLDAVMGALLKLTPKQNVELEAVEKVPQLEGGDLT